MSDKGPGLTYEASGVDIEAGDALVQRIGPLARTTMRAGSLDGLGGFAGLFDPKAAGYSDPILVAATDGVGTKLRVAIEMGDLSTIGVDLVAMCVNDLVCQGAEPLFFLDYYATGALDVAAAEVVIAGIAAACKSVGCALLGGETAEMPGHYQGRDFDLAGFAVGAVARGRMIPSGVAADDILLGLRSSGIHSNGYSLVRRIVAQERLNWNDPAPFEAGDRTLGEVMLEPTRLYSKAVLAAHRSDGLSAAAHITGGGIPGNLPRILPQGFGAEIDLGAWKMRPVFHWLMERAGLGSDDMLRTFNCGIGMVLTVKKDHAEEQIELLRRHDLAVDIIGRVVEGGGLRFTGNLR